MSELLLGSSEVKPFDGNWAELQASRTCSDDFIEKLWFFDALMAGPEIVSSPPPAFVSGYMNLHRDVTSVVLYSNAPEGLRHALGRAKHGSPPHVYSDATHFGQSVTGRQKDI